MRVVVINQLFHGRHDFHQTRQCQRRPPPSRPPPLSPPTNSQLLSMQQEEAKLHPLQPLPPAALNPLSQPTHENKLCANSITSINRNRRVRPRNWINRTLMGGRTSIDSSGNGI